MLRFPKAWQTSKLSSPQLPKAKQSEPWKDDPQKYQPSTKVQILKVFKIALFTSVRIVFFGGDPNSYTPQKLTAFHMSSWSFGEQIMNSVLFMGDGCRFLFWIFQGVYFNWITSKKKQTHSKRMRCFGFQSHTQSRILSGCIPVRRTYLDP